MIGFFSYWAYLSYILMMGTEMSILSLWISMFFCKHYSFNAKISDRSYLTCSRISIWISLGLRQSRPSTATSISFCRLYSSFRTYAYLPRYLHLCIVLLLEQCCIVNHNLVVDGRQSSDNLVKDICLGV
jgi:hypothetical protein